MLKKILTAEGGTAWAYLAGMISVLVVLATLPNWVTANALLLAGCLVTVWFATRKPLLGVHFEALLGGNDGQPEPSKATNEETGD